MVGFTPGFAYMGSTHERLGLPRRSSPRTRVPAGSVGIAMGQTGIYPSATPGGWNLLGRAEHRDLFDLSRDPPSYFLPGDRVRFGRLSPFPNAPMSRPPVEAPGASALDVLGRRPLDYGAGPRARRIPEVRRSRGRGGGRPALRAANRLVGNEPGPRA
jgi:hypothetical protein